MVFGTKASKATLFLRELCRVLQNMTIQSVACATLVNVGSQLAASNHPGFASVLFGGSSIIGFLVYKGFKRVRRIDKFERNMRG